MKFFKKYNEFFNPINENAVQAKKILKENEVDPNNPDFIELKDVLLKKSPGYLGLFTKFRFEEGIEMAQLSNLIRLMGINKDLLASLPKPIVEYTKFHDLLDAVQELESERQAKKILNGVKGDLRRELFELEPQQLRPYIDLAAKIAAEFSEKEIKVFTTTLSRVKDLDDLMIDMELFVNKMGEDESFNELKGKIESAEYSKIVFSDPKNKIIVARIGEYIDSFKLGSFKWCISKDHGVSSWNSYVENGNNVQYFVWNLNYKKYEGFYIVGITVNPDGSISECQDSQNRPLEYNEFLTVSGLSSKVFKPLSKKELKEKELQKEERKKRLAEFEAQQKAERARVRAIRAGEREAEGVYEGDPYPYALQKYLIDEGIMEEDESVYTIEETDYNHYGLRQFTFGHDEYNNEMSWAIGTDEEADAAATEYYESLFDEIGFAGLPRHFLESVIDTEHIIRDYGYDYDYVAESPESFLDKEMRPGVEEQKDSLEIQVNELQDQQSEFEDGSPEYIELQTKIDEIDEKIVEMQDEDNDEYWWYSDEKIQEKVDELNQELEDDPLSFLEDRGYISFEKNGRLEEDSNKTLDNYIDKDKYVKELIESDGRGPMSGYDGRENEVSFEGETYYIYRVN